MDLIALVKDPAIGTIIGIIGLLAASVFYIRSKREKRFVFVNKENVVIDDRKNKFEKRLKITFDEVNITRVTRSVFAVWNAGRSPIRKSDIAEGDPLRVEFPAGTRILTTSVDKISRDAIRIALGPSDSGSSVLVQFDFLDFRDGANFSIAHTAPAGSWAFKGTVLGMPEGLRDFGPSMIDIEKFQTPIPKRSWYFRLLRGAISGTVKWILLIIPPVWVLGSIFTHATLSVLPSLGRPDTSAMLVPGRINVFMLTLGLIFVGIEAFILIETLKLPPKVLTKREWSQAAGAEGESTDQATGISA